MTACRRLEKLVLPFIFDVKSFILDDVKHVELSINSFDWKNVSFWGIKTYCDPSYIFSGRIKIPSPPRIYDYVGASEQNIYYFCHIYAAFVCLSSWKLIDELYWNFWNV